MKITNIDIYSIALYLITLFGIGSVSVYRTKEQGKTLKEIQNRLNLSSGDNRLVTIQELRERISNCAGTHNMISEQMTKDIEEIKNTLKQGEIARNRARESRDSHMSALTIAIEELVKKSNKTV